MANSYPFISLRKEGVEMSVRVLPNAHSSAVRGIWNNQFLKIALTAPAVDGKANEALINFLADNLKIKKSSIFIVTGHVSRCKLVHISVNLHEIEDILNQWVSQK